MRIFPRRMWIVLRIRRRREAEVGAVIAVCDT